mmetsp:Transcript_59575/g.146329  ORF Transcript_59575/g.146329 Transcript_59575/m.146329 type:complete len:300 (-) Transcript_59575:1469-2368(-)
MVSEKRKEQLFFCCKKFKKHDFLEKIILKLNFKKRIPLIKKKKRLSSKKRLDKFYKFFLKKSNYQNSLIVIHGVQFQPFLCLQEFWKMSSAIVKKKFLLNKKVQQNNLDKKMNLSSDDIFFLKYVEYTTIYHGKVLPISFNLQHKFEKYLFEETADSLKFFLEIDLIKFSISQNQKLISYWLHESFTLKKTKIFWSSYFSSCFKVMIQNQKISDFTNLRREFHLEKLKKNSNIPDWESYWLAENSNTVGDGNLYDNLYSGFFLLSEENLKKSEILIKKVFPFYWRNRNYKQTIHFDSFF